MLIHNLCQKMQNIPINDDEYINAKIPIKKIIMKTS